MSTTDQERSTVRPARQHHALETISRRRWVRLAIAYLVLGASAWWYAPNADLAGWWVHGLWCFIGLALASPTLWRVVRGGFGVVLTDHRVVFLAAFSLYFLVGAALLAVGPTRQAEISLSLYPIDPSNALRVDAVNGLGFGFALLTSAVARGRWLGMQAGRVAALVRATSSKASTRCNTSMSWARWTSGGS